MAREISSICDFIFGLIRTCLLTDMVDVDLILRTVKVIYTYRKDHTTESTIFTPWRKKLIPFSFLRWEIHAFQDDKRQNMTIPWKDNNTFQFSTPSKMPRYLTKQTTGKIRTRWLSRNQFNPIKTKRHNTPDIKVSELDRVDIKAPILIKACDSFSLSCLYCKQGVLHPFPQESDWSSKDWDGTKTKAREQNNSLIDFNDPKPQTNIDQTTDIDKVAFSKLQIRQSSLKEELNRGNEITNPTDTSDQKHQEKQQGTPTEKSYWKWRRGFRKKKKYMIYTKEYM